MNEREFKQFLSTAKDVGQIVAAVLEGAAEENIDLRRAARNFPVWGIAFVGAAGALAGWLAAKRSQPSQAPPPTLAETTRAFVEDAGSKLRDRIEETLAGEPQVRDVIEQVVPAARDAERAVEEVGVRARKWFDAVVEPRLREGLNGIAANVQQGTFPDLLGDRHDDIELPDRDDTEETGV